MQNIWNNDFFVDSSKPSSLKSTSSILNVEKNLQASSSSCNQKSSVTCEKLQEKRRSNSLTRKHFENTKSAEHKELWIWGGNDCGQLGQRDLLYRFF